MKASADRQVRERKQPRALTCPSACDRRRYRAARDSTAPGSSRCRSRRCRSARACVGALERSERFDLVVVPRVALAGECGRRYRAKACGSRQRERIEVGQPQQRHWREGGRHRRIADERIRRAPLARSRPADEGRRKWIGVQAPQRNDLHSNFLPDPQPRVSRQSFVSQVIEVRRVERGRLCRIEADEHIVRRGSNRRRARAVGPRHFREVRLKPVFDRLYGVVYCGLNERESTTPVGPGRPTVTAPTAISFQSVTASASPNFMMPSHSARPALHSGGVVIACCTLSVSHSAGATRSSRELQATNVAALSIERAIPRMFILFSLDKGQRTRDHLVSGSGAEESGRDLICAPGIVRRIPSLPT